MILNDFGLQGINYFLDKYLDEQIISVLSFKFESKLKINK